MNKKTKDMSLKEQVKAWIPWINAICNRCWSIKEDTRRHACQKCLDKAKNKNKQRQKDYFAKRTRENRRKKPTNHNCVICGKKFVRFGVGSWRKKTCSKECSKQLNRNIARRNKRKQKEN